MAARMVSSAVGQEAVNQVLSRIKEAYQEKQSDAKEHIERMEMAHIKLEAALETSNRWNVTSAPLLSWRGKLKRAAQECDHTVRQCRQRLEQEEEIKQGLRSSSFSKWVTHTARSFVSSIFSDNDDKLTRSTAVRRFERFAEGASEFLRYVELGCTPHRCMFPDPLIRHLIAGKGTKYCSVFNGQHLSFLLQPCSPLQEHGMEVGLMLLLEDTNKPENNFALVLNLRLSENTDIVRIAVGCLQLFIPYLGSTVQTVKTKLTQVPTQDLCWVSDAYPVFGHYVEHQDNLHTSSSKWFRPNPLCCQQQHHHYSQSYNSKSSSSESLPCDIYLQPVIQVYLLGHVALSVANNMQRAVADGESKTSPMSEFPYLKLGVQFYPHALFEDLSPGVEGSAIEIINGAAVKHRLYAKISFEQLGDFMIPKAVDCFHGSAAATTYQMLWKSKHGGAHLQVEKTSWGLTTGRGMGGKRPKQRQVKKVQGWPSANKDFMSSWVAHAPAHLQGTIVDCVQKEKRLPLPLLFKNNPCIDCPIMLVSSQYHRSLARKIKSCRMFKT